MLSMFSSIGCSPWILATQAKSTHTSTYKQFADVVLSVDISLNEKVSIASKKVAATTLQDSESTTTATESQQNHSNNCRKKKTFFWWVFVFTLEKIGSNQMCRHKHVCRTWFLHFRLGHSNIPLISIELLPQPYRTHCKSFAFFPDRIFFLFLLLPALATNVFFCFLSLSLNSFRHLPFSFSLSQHHHPASPFHLPMFYCDANENCAFITFSINSFPINGLKSWQTEKLSFK